MKVKKTIITTIDTNIDVECVTLLSEEEYIKNCSIIPYLFGWWWLRSPGNNQCYAAGVRPGGSLDIYYVYYDDGCVRPALKIKNTNCLKPGDRVEIIGKSWTVLNDNILLCDSFVGNTAFKNDIYADKPNEYETSDIKQWLQKWAVENNIQLC